MSKSKTYTIDTSCSNCDYVGKAILPRKQKVSDVLPKTECPTCGCCTLSKKNKVVLKPFSPLTNTPKIVPCTLPHYPQKKRKVVPLFPDTTPKRWLDRMPWDSPVWCGNRTSDDSRKLRTSMTIGTSSKSNQMLVN